MKKIIILKHGGGELANQLWNYISIYAYGLDSKTLVQNPSFFEYHHFFNLLKNESVLTKIRTWFFRTPRRRSHPINKIARFKYGIQIKIMEHLHKKCLLSSLNTLNTSVYLPPTKILSQNLEKCNILYLTGWLFRNPIGINKFRKELMETFKPVKKVEDKVEAIIGQLKNKYEHVIGVHIRQADYKTFKESAYFLEQGRVREIINEYIAVYNLDKEKTVFLITSDGPVKTEVFKGLNIYVSKENAVVDLFLLSKTSAIIGSDSSFGAFGAWYGNVPHIVMKKGLMDWNYYDGNKTYFDNKYLTLLAR
jgi:hypothetical protein